MMAALVVFAGGEMELEGGEDECWAITAAEFVLPWGVEGVGAGHVVVDIGGRAATEVGVVVVGHEASEGLLACDLATFHHHVEIHHELSL